MGGGVVGVLRTDYRGSTQAATAEGGGGPEEDKEKFKSVGRRWWRAAGGDFRVASQRAIRKAEMIALDAGALSFARQLRYYFVHRMKSMEVVNKGAASHVPKYMHI